MSTSAELPPVAQEPTSPGDRFLAAIPSASASKPHIWLLVFMWVVLVPTALIWPHLIPLSVMIALGNHTNIVSAVGASIAAGASTATHRQVKLHRARVEELHTKLDALTPSTGAKS
jgi:hypothetical protein